MRGLCKYTAERHTGRSLQIVTSNQTHSLKKMQIGYRPLNACDSRSLFILPTSPAKKNFPEPGAFPRPVPCALLRIVQQNLIRTVNAPRLRKVRRIGEVWGGKEPCERVPSLPKVLFPPQGLLPSPTHNPRADVTMSPTPERTSVGR